MNRLSISKITLLGASLIVAAVGILLLQSNGGPEIGPEARYAEPNEDEKTGADGCPEGAEGAGLGPEMVRLPEGFCIDTTEVSRSQYDAWLGTSPQTTGQGGACSDNGEFTPSCSWPPGNNADLPVVCVDWCDAKAFCEAAGKRLCGGIRDGSAYSLDAYDDPSVSEWHAACTSGGTYQYTYGDEPDTESCREGDAEDSSTWGLGSVGSFADCHSPETEYAAVYDLSGNAAEWDNSCEGSDPADGCRIRGGSFEHQGRGLRCAMAKGLRWPRMRKVQAVGFRCCANGG